MYKEVYDDKNCEKMNVIMKPSRCQSNVFATVGGPVGLAAGVAVGGIMAYEFEKHVWQKVLEILKQESVTYPTLDSVENYHDR
jgi:hypothetical protein